jgi:hypothetical protein
MRVNELARLEDLPYYLFGFKGLNALVVNASFEFLQNRAIQLLENKVYPPALSEHLN